MFKKKESGLDKTLKITALVTMVVSLVGAIYGVVETIKAASWLKGFEQN